MKKLSIKSARLISNLVLVAVLVALTLLCFVPQRVVYLSGGESYAPYYSGDSSKEQVGLMFNVYEGTDVVNGILDELKVHNAKATFFVGGCWADDNAETLRRIVAEGHELGNHGYFHKNHKSLSSLDNQSEITHCHEIVKGITGVDMSLFAPPSGAFSVETLKVAESLKYKTILWTNDTIDWRDSDINLLFSRATKNAASGTLILMHPKPHTLKVLPRIIKYYQGKGMACVTVSQCI